MPNLIGIGIYVRNSPKAVELYQAAFGLELGYHIRNRDNTFYHAELLKNGLPFCCVVETKEAKYTEGTPVELGCTFETRSELERAFSVLKDGGTAVSDPHELPWSPCAAAVTDCFGVNWFLSLPQHRPPDSWTPEE